MAKKHKNRDSWDIDREDQLAMIFDGYSISEREETETINHDSIQTIDDGDPNYADEVMNDVLRDIMGNDNSSNDCDCCNEDPEIPDCDGPIAQTHKYPTQVPDGTDLNSIKPYGTYMVNDNREDNTPKPLGPKELSIIAESAAMAAVSNIDSGDNDDEDEEDFICPEVSIMYNEQANIVTFTDGYNSTSINMSSLVKNGKYGNPNPDNVAQQIMGVVESCITTTLPMVVISEDEFHDLMDMTARFDSDKYRFCKISIFTKKDAYAVYKLADDFFDELDKITQFTTRNNVTMMFLKVLQNYCYDPNHMYAISVGNGDDWYSIVNEEIKDSCGEFDWQWDVFFQTNGVDPITSQGRGVMSREEIEEKFASAITEPGRYVSADLTSQPLSSDDVVVMETPRPTEVSCGVDADDYMDDEDDEEDDEDGFDSDAMDAPEGLNLDDFGDDDDIAAQLAEGLDDSDESSVSIEVSETTTTTVTVTEEPKSDDKPDSTSSVYAADDFVFDTVRTKPDNN